MDAMSPATTPVAWSGRSPSASKANVGPLNSCGLYAEGDSGAFISARHNVKDVRRLCAIGDS